MPPKRREETPPTSDSDDGDMDAQMANYARFTNPNYHREFMAGLPPKIRERVQALMGMDDTYKQMLKEHTEAVNKARKALEVTAKPIFERRKEIVAGAKKPTTEEVNAGFDEIPDHKGKVECDAAAACAEDGGIDGFWLKVLQHHVIINEMISERDEEALKALKDVSVESLDAPAKGFTLTFTFDDNKFFKEKVITKTYHMTDDPITEESQMEKSVCSGITWNEGQNLTVEIKTKKQKSKKKPGQTRLVEYEEPCDSFFNFFKSEGAEEEDAEQWFALADTLVEKVIPFAVEYYTGEAPDGSSDMEDDDEEFEDDEEEEDDDEDGPGAGPSSRGRGGYGGGRGGAGGPAPKPGGKECKQQ